MNSPDSTGDGHPATRVAIAAGGTGGHIMPALALGDALREIQPGLELLYFSGDKEQERRWYGQAGVAPLQLPAAPLRKGLTGKLAAARAALRSYRRASQTLKRFSPAVVVCMGSYVGGPVGLAAWRRKIPLIVHEQNSIAGKSNRWLASRATAVAATFPDSFQGISIQRLENTGNPLRKTVLAPIDRGTACQQFQLDPERFTILISGASQGAKNVNEALIGLLSRFTSEEECPWQALWICGANLFDSVRERAADLPAASRARLVPFVENMNAAYAASDLAICRASSATLFEAAAWRLPIVAIPLPWAADGHQKRNAEWFEQAGACVMIEETDLNADSLNRQIRLMMDAPDRRSAMAEASGSMAQPDAAQKLARLTLDIARKA